MKYLKTFDQINEQEYYENFKEIEEVVEEYIGMVIEDWHEGDVKSIVIAASGRKDLLDGGEIDHEVIQDVISDYAEQRDPQ